MYVDVHAHLYEYSRDELEKHVSDDMVLVVVAEDYESSKKSLELARSYDNIVPCVGLHPWNIRDLDSSLRETEKILKLAGDNDVRCLGEVGLDTKFVGETIEVQLRVLKVFLEYAERVGDISLNLHTAGTWQQVLDLIRGLPVKAANFHWYTGPQHLLEEIERHGYTISINPAVKIQEKHRVIAKVAPLEIMLTESDSPYKYRGLELTPLMVKETVAVIAELKHMRQEDVAAKVYENFMKRYGYLLELKKTKTT